MAASDQESEKELKITEPDKVEILEPKEPVCVAASSAESGKKIEEKKIEPHVAEEVKELKTDEEPKAAEPETAAAASTESGAKIEEKKTEPPVAEEAEEIKKYEKPKAEDAAEPTAQKVDDKQVESPVIEEETKTEDSPITEGTKETVLESGTTNNSEPSTECKSEDTGSGSAAEKGESRSELVEEKIEELPSKVEELPVAEVERIVKISDSTPLVEEKPLEQPEVTELTVKEPIVVDPVKDVEVETGIDKVEDSKLPIEVEAAKEETIVVEILDQVNSDTPEIKVLVKDVEYSPSGELLEKSVETRAVKIEPGKNEVETAEKSVVADKPSAECEGDTEKTAESEAISRDIELAPEYEKKEETVASGETNTAAEVDDKAEKEATITEREAKEAEKTPVTETKLNEEKKDDEAVKAGAQESECTKDSEETRTSQGVPKEDVPVKKQSNNIIKMMKHSLGKAKKAIVGKSQNPKTPAASETKGELTK